MLCNDISSVEERAPGRRDIGTAHSYDDVMEIIKSFFPTMVTKACYADRDESRGWPTLHLVKQKHVITCVHGTRKLSLYIQGHDTRRQPSQRDLGISRWVDVQGWRVMTVDGTAMVMAIDGTDMVVAADGTHCEADAAMMTPW